jgi:Fur family transcriptional regulator, ferric uptake regulator
MTGRKWFNTLHNSGYRLTAPRRAIVEVMERSTHLLTPFEVFEAARKNCPALGLVSVYRTLEKLEELGLVQRVHQTRECQAFLRAGEGHQHLIVCTHCGEAVLFEGDQLEGLFNSISQNTGFRIDGHWLQVFGLCKTCRSSLQV